MELMVYALIDPRDNLIKYVGCSKQPAKRLYEHWTQFHDWGSKVVWMRELKEMGTRPRLFVLGAYPANEAKIQEREWFYFLLAQGYPMLNDPAKLTGGSLRTGGPFEDLAVVYHWYKHHRARLIESCG